MYVSYVYIYMYVYIHTYWCIIYDIYIYMSVGINSQRAQIRSVEPQVTLKWEKSDMLNFNFQLRWRDKIYPLALSNQPINKKTTKQQQNNHRQKGYETMVVKTGHETREMEKWNKVRRLIAPAYCFEKISGSCRVTQKLPCGLSWGNRAEHLGRPRKL